MAGWVESFLVKSWCSRGHDLPMRLRSRARSGRDVTGRRPRRDRGQGAFPGAARYLFPALRHAAPRQRMRPSDDCRRVHQRASRMPCSDSTLQHLPRSFRTRSPPRLRTSSRSRRTVDFNRWQIGGIFRPRSTPSGGPATRAGRRGHRVAVCRPAGTVAGHPGPGRPAGHVWQRCARPGRPAKSPRRNRHLFMMKSPTSSTTGARPTRRAWPADARGADACGKADRTQRRRSSRCANETSGAARSSFFRQRGAGSSTSRRPSARR